MWNPETTRPAAQATELTSGVGVRVIDLKGSTVFDSSVIIDEQQGDVFTSFAPQDRSQAVTASIVLPDGEKVGTVRLWVYGSEALMRQPDQEFRDNSYQAMFIAGGVAIVLASCIGFLFARNLVSPINRIMKTAPGHRRRRSVGPHEADRRGRGGPPRRDLRRHGRVGGEGPRFGAAASPPTSPTSCAPRSWPSRPRWRP